MSFNQLRDPKADAERLAKARADRLSPRYGQLETTPRRIVAAYEINRAWGAAVAVVNAELAGSRPAQAAAPTATSWDAVIGAINEETRTGSRNSAPAKAGWDDVVGRINDEARAGAPEPAQMKEPFQRAR